MESINCVYHPVEELHSAKCPYCGVSYYQELYSITTCLYCPPIYKDGVNINPDSNQSTIICHCLNCGKDFSTNK